MEKLGNWFAIAKKWEYLVRFSVSARADQSTGFSVNGSSTPNGLFQTINGLKQLMGYSKRLHQL